MQMLLASGVYGQGRGQRGTLTWSPVAPVMDALQEGFLSGFPERCSTGKAFYMA